MTEERRRFAREALFCESILAKTGDNVLLETLRGAPEIATWRHFPEGDVYDPQSGAHWYYHCHDAAGAAGEHGHFHCFLRPDGRDGPIHHLVAIGVDAYGRLLRLFTVNQWVVGDDWADAETTIALLGRFDAHVGRPNYLVNRWLTALIGLYGAEIADLIRARDARLAAHGADAAAVRADRGLEVVSTSSVDLAETARALGLGA